MPVNNACNCETTFEFVLPQILDRSFNFGDIMMVYWVYGSLDLKPFLQQKYVCYVCVVFVYDPLVLSRLIFISVNWNISYRTSRMFGIK